MTAYYNEHEPFAAQWLRNLILARHIAPGEVDERSIEDVRPFELAGFTQCHFFAGIGVWSLALRQAGWPDDRLVWTGSCPCQPFSAAGKGTGFADERHLWPAWFHLIGQCAPVTIFGEQVANADAWVDLIQTDLEALDYAFGAVPLPASCVGAPHIRDRLFWVANTHRLHEQQWQKDQWVSEPARRSETGQLADTIGDGLQRRICRRQDSQWETQHGPTGCDRTITPWSNADWLPCRDGKWRPVEPGTFPLAHGTPARVGRLRAYGNAIVAEVARKVIETVM